MLRRRTIVFTVFGLAVAIAVGLGFAKPRWIKRVVQFSDGGGVHQVDEKWLFGTIPYSRLERRPGLDVTPQALEAVRRTVGNPTEMNKLSPKWGVHTTYLGKDERPKGEAFTLAYDFNGNPLPVMAEFGKHLVGSPSARRSGSRSLMYDLTGEAADGSLVHIWYERPPGSASARLSIDIHRNNL